MRPVCPVHVHILAGATGVAGAWFIRTCPHRPGTSVCCVAGALITRTHTAPYEQQQSTTTPKLQTTYYDKF